MKGPGYGGRGKPRKDRTGDEYGGLVVLLSMRRKNQFGWWCRCKRCGNEWFVATNHMSEYARRGHGCGCQHGKGLALWHLSTGHRVAS